MYAGKIFNQYYYANYIIAIDLSLFYLFPTVNHIILKIIETKKSCPEKLEKGLFSIKTPQFIFKCRNQW